MARGITLAAPGCKESIAKRIGAVHPKSERQWGKMSAHQMICHLTDSFTGVMGERPISPAFIPMPKSLMKWMVLWSPMKWPKGVKTRPEIDQAAGGGTRPTDFEADRRALLEAMDRFCSIADSKRAPHPMMGSMNNEEWMRWGYLHCDHHLRQFGA